MDVPRRIRKNESTPMRGAFLLGGAIMAGLLMGIGKLLTMFVTLPIIAMLLLTLIGAVMSKNDNYG